MYAFIGSNKITWLRGRRTRVELNLYIVVLFGNQTLVNSLHAELWNRWIRLSCYNNRVYNTCPLYTHVTPILQCIGPCKLFKSVRPMFSYIVLIKSWTYKPWIRNSLHKKIELLWILAKHRIYSRSHYLSIVQTQPSPPMLGLVDKIFMLVLLLVRHVFFWVIIILHRRLEGWVGWNNRFKHAPRGSYCWLYFVRYRFDDF